MKKTIQDEVVDEVMKNLADLKAYVRKEYKGTQEFRQKPMPRQQQTWLWANMPREFIAEALENQRQFYEGRIMEMLAQYPPEQHAQLIEQFKTPDEMAEEDMNEFIFEQEQVLAGGRRNA